ncbi:MAG: DUF6134 family protein [Geminicoccaceae bacterium]
MTEPGIGHETAGRRGGLDRRSMLALTASGLLMPAPRLLAATPVPKDLSFRIYRKGDDIGIHTMRFAPVPGGMSVDTEIDLKVKMAFVTVFSYEQRGRDIWKDGKLVEAEYITDDDGKKTRVEVNAEGERLRFDGPSGPFEMPLGTMTDLAFWNDAIVRVHQLVDSQTAEVAQVSSQPGKSERLLVAGQELQASRYELASSNGRSGSIWYDEQGRWVKGIMNTRGETLDYVLA